MTTTLTLPPTEPRRIIQIFNADNDTCALCNDGTIWYWSSLGEKWHPWLGAIPQEEVA